MEPEVTPSILPQSNLTLFPNRPAGKGEEKNTPHKHRPFHSTTESGIGPTFLPSIFVGLWLPPVSSTTFLKR